MSYLSQKEFQFWGVVFAAFIACLWLLGDILMPFVVGFVVAYLLNPLVKKLEGHQVPRWLSALLLLSIFVVLMVVGLAFLIPFLVQQAAGFVATLPGLYHNGVRWIGETLPMIDIPQNFDDLKNADKSALTDQLGPVVDATKNILGNVLKGGAAVVGFISFMALMPIVAFYLMVDWPRLIEKIYGLIPQKKSGKITQIFHEIDQSLAGFIRGQLIVCFILGGFYAIALSLLGLEYGFFVGVASGVLSIIPYVGSIFGLVASVGLAFYQFGGWEYPLAAFAIFAVGQLVEGNYLTPKLVGDSVGLHPLWVIFALMAGGAMLGLLGMVIAIPVAAIIAVLVRHGVAEYKDSSYYKGKAKG